MTSQHDEKTKLSKGILDMKFMKRSKEKALQQKEADDGFGFFSDVITEEMKQGSNKFIVETSFVPCEDLIVGRLSFQGMNPVIERIMQEEEDAKREKVAPKVEADVSDNEMAHRYSTLVGTIGRKYNTKRGHTREHIHKGESRSSAPKKKKFLKPQED
uniref:M-phase phosphoprotein 6 n=1 Tax=Timema genevievae TaxID=629358 RepID=A0A7R9PMG2_TIMGE|nr:unnamed protein product [Timema genevievae]